MTDEMIESPDTKRENRVPPGQRSTGRFPVLHAGKVPDIDISEWTFRIWGLVREEKELSFDEFMNLPRVTVLSDIHCVTGWSKLDNKWEGVSTSALGNLVEILPGAKFAIVHAFGGFTTNLTLEDFFQQDVVLAVKRGGKPLSPGHGYPVRLVVPRLYFWKSAKWVTGVELIDTDRLGFWETRGYHNRGDPWEEERYSR